ncbi:MAG: phospholipase D family protein [Candidatus Thorarchaeota archaeon]
MGTDYYFNIVRIIEDSVRDKKAFIIKDVINLRELQSHDYSEIKAFLKYLIQIEKIIIIQKENRTFEDYIVKWNPDLRITFPVIEDLTFKDVKACVTLPPFNIYGLTDILNEKQIKVNFLKDEFEKLFQSAQKSIKICSPFIDWNGFRYFKDILISKAKKKVNIQILSREIEKQKNFYKFQELERIYTFFKDNFLTPFVDIRNYYFETEDKRLASSIHAKLIIIDNERAYVGSGEIRENSFKKNLEIGVILSGKKIEKFVLIFDNLFARSEVIRFE